MKRIILFALTFGFSLLTHAADEEENRNKSSATSDTEVYASRDKAAKELPKVLYVVPWKEMETSKNADQKLVLHDFFGDLYDPVLPGEKVEAVTGDK